MTKIKTDLKTLLIENLKSLNEATSPKTIWNLFQAMKNETNDVFKAKIFDSEKVRDYCWNLASYAGQQKDKLTGLITAERNKLFEDNVLRAIAIYKEKQVNGSDSKIEFKEKAFVVSLKDYKPNHKDLKKNPNKKVKLPLSEIVEFTDYAITGERKTKGTTAKPIFSVALYDAIVAFKTAILKGNGLMNYDKAENKYSFNYESFVDKFDDDVITDLENLKGFINLLLQVNATAINNLEENGNCTVEEQIIEQHVVEFKPHLNIVKAS